MPVILKPRKLFNSIPRADICLCGLTSKVSRCRWQEENQGTTESRIQSPEAVGFNAAKHWCTKLSPLQH